MFFFSCVCLIGKKKTWPNSYEINFKQYNFSSMKYYKGYSNTDNNLYWFRKPYYMSGMFSKWGGRP